ncbi:MAG: NAD(P)H-hydrate dehydratase [Clostridiaceae bacterium]|nr:NAD(P)H-hydrate dehydratase [Clostridiaceae bacterium]
MQYIVNAKEAKQIDGISIEEIGIPSFVLMERASLRVVECVKRQLPGKGRRIAVVAGSGNNGGDAVAAGRILAEGGDLVTIFFLGTEEKATAECKAQLAIARKLDLSVCCESEEPASLKQFEGIIDGIFGIGLSREITGRHLRWIEEINASEAVVFSVDIPSGVDASTGQIWGTAVQADITVTFGVNKLGLVLFPGAEYAGTVFTEDIGFPKKAIQMVKPRCFTYGREDVSLLFPKRKKRSHKGSYGKTLIIAGSEQMSGAALFAAKAAYLMGSGLVKVISHENNRNMLQTQLPEALFAFYRTADDGSLLFEEEKGGSGIKRLLAEIAWASAVVAGPGIHVGNGSQEILDAMLQVTDKPVLLDADALNMLAQREKWFDSDRRILLPPNFLITPHLKEMSRLQQCPVSHIKEHLGEYVLKSGTEKKAGAVIVLKDAKTLVSDGKQIYLNTSGNSALAKGGSGDVLSGMIGGLLAQGMPPFQAAALAVYLHGLTAEEYVKSKSASSMLATDILAMLAAVLP